jgi:extracellular elastinolytic metalloproteinase
MTYRTRTKTVLSLSTLSIASLASALVVAPQAAPSLASSPFPVDGTTSVRKSINFGPHVPTASHSDGLDASAALTGWNFHRGADALNLSSSKCDYHSDSLRCVGRELATQFVASLHPDAEFKLVDGYLSRHNGLYHAHFIQLSTGLPIANANLNVNIDLSTGKVLSYGDSSFANAKKTVVVGGASKDNWKQRVTGWASDAAERVEQGAQQIVFGASASHWNDNGPQGLKKRAQGVADPRQGLLTFLTVQTSSQTVADLMTSQPRKYQVDQLSIREPFAHENGADLVIDGHPEAVEPTKASLVHIHDGDKLSLAWKYEIRVRFLSFFSLF